MAKKKSDLPFWELGLNPITMQKPEKIQEYGVKLYDTLNIAYMGKNRINYED